MSSKARRNLLGLVFDWPNHSLTRALQAPPMAARHVMASGENRWLECHQRSVGSLLRVGSSGQGKGTKILSAKDVLSFCHWQNKSKKQNPLSTLCWVVVFVVCFFFCVHVSGSFCPFSYLFLFFLKRKCSEDTRREEKMTVKCLAASVYSTLAG